MVFRGVNLVRLDDKDRKGQRPVCGAHTPPPNNLVTKVSNFCEGKWVHLFFAESLVQDVRSWAEFMIRCCYGYPWRREWQPTPVFLSWRIPWTEEPVPYSLVHEAAKSQT